MIAWFFLLTGMHRPHHSQELGKSPGLTTHLGKPITNSRRFVVAKRGFLNAHKGKARSISTQQSDTYER